MKKYRILIGSGEKAVRSLAAAVLDNHEYHVELAADGHEIFQHLKRSVYDLIIVDNKGPEMESLGLIQVIRSKFPALPIIILTTIGPFCEFLECGATDCIAKPFDVFEFRMIVTTLLRQNEDPKIWIH